MSRPEQERRMVLRLAVQMARKLRSNRHKPDWDGEDIGHLMERVHEEYLELDEAIVMGLPASEVWKEAADVANIAAMVASNYESSRSRERAASSNAD